MDQIAEQLQDTDDEEVESEEVVAEETTEQEVAVELSAEDHLRMLEGYIYLLLLCQSHPKRC